MAGRVVLFGTLALAVLSAHVHALVVPIMARRQVSQPRLVLTRTLRPQRTIVLNQPAVPTVSQTRLSPVLQTLIRPRVQSFVTPVRQNTARPTTIIIPRQQTVLNTRSPPPPSTATSNSESGVTVTVSSGCGPHGCGGCGPHGCGGAQNGDNYYSEDLRRPAIQQTGMAPASSIFTPMATEAYDQTVPVMSNPTVVVPQVEDGRVGRSFSSGTNAVSRSVTRGVIVDIGSPTGCGSHGCNGGGGHKGHNGHNGGSKVYYAYDQTVPVMSNPTVMVPQVEEVPVVSSSDDNGLYLAPSVGTTLY